MAIPSENYGFLPQLSTFERGACAPTATANIMAAMAKTYPSLRTLINVDGGVTYQDIAATRNNLGAKYFLTSNDWTPVGSPVSMVIKGLQDYAADRNLAQALKVEAIGPSVNSPQIKMLGNFGVTREIRIDPPSRPDRKINVTTPSLNDPIIKRSYKDTGVTIQTIQEALNNGSGLLLGLIYPEGEGHVVSAVSLDWSDRNGNGKAEAEENATVSIVDPLNPSKNYSQATPGNVENEQTFDPLVGALGPVRTTEMKLISKADDSLTFEYRQISVSYDNETGKPIEAAGDSSNNTTNEAASGDIAFAGVLTARSVKRDIITGTSDDDVIELDPGRQRIKGGKGSDAFVIGDPESLQEGQSDLIIDFKPQQNDLIVLSGNDLSIEEIDLISVNSRFEKNLAKRSDHTLIYLQQESTGILYLNSNGDDPGWGTNGGELIRLKGAPDLDASDLFIN